jgi:hypothetical protein
LAPSISMLIPNKKPIERFIVEPVFVEPDCVVILSPFQMKESPQERIAQRPARPRRSVH